MNSLNRDVYYINCVFPSLAGLFISSLIVRFLSLVLSEDGCCDTQLKLSIKTFPALESLFESCLYHVLLISQTSSKLTLSFEAFLLVQVFLFRFLETCSFA